MLFIFVTYIRPPSRYSTFNVEREVETVEAESEVQVRAIEADLPNRIRRLVAKPNAEKVEVYKVGRPDYTYKMVIEEVA